MGKGVWLLVTTSWRHEPGLRAAGACAPRPSVPPEATHPSVLHLHVREDAQSSPRRV